jgi:hypothetical protein
MREARCGLRPLELSDSSLPSPVSSFAATADPSSSSGRKLNQSGTSQASDFAGDLLNQLVSGPAAIWTRPGVSSVLPDHEPNA